MPISQKTAAFLTVPGIYDIMSLTKNHPPFSRYGAYVSVTRNEGKNGEGDAKELISARGRSPQMRSGSSGKNHCTAVLQYVLPESKGELRKL